MVRGMRSQVLCFSGGVLLCRGRRRREQRGPHKFCDGRPGAQDAGRRRYGGQEQGHLRADGPPEGAPAPRPLRGAPPRDDQGGHVRGACGGRADPVGGAERQ
eukprot:158157-Prymnesium_polylepis.1